jgi:hypothetical protein
VGCPVSFYPLLHRSGSSLVANRTTFKGRDGCLFSVPSSWRKFFSTIPPWVGYCVLRGAFHIPESLSTVFQIYDRGGTVLPLSHRPNPMEFRSASQLEGYEELCGVPIRVKRHRGVRITIYNDRYHASRFFISFFELF